jgi:hypothetical protein
MFVRVLVCMCMFIAVFVRVLVCMYVLITVFVRVLIRVPMFVAVRMLVRSPVRSPVRCSLSCCCLRARGDRCRGLSVIGMVFVHYPEAFVAGEQQLIGNGTGRFEDAHDAESVGICMDEVFVFNKAMRAFESIAEAKTQLVSHCSAGDHFERCLPSFTLCDFSFVEIQKIVGSAHDAVAAVAIAEGERDRFFDKGMSWVEEGL